MRAHRSPAEARSYNHVVFVAHGRYRRECRSIERHLNSSGIPAIVPSIPTFGGEPRCSEGSFSSRLPACSRQVPLLRTRTIRNKRTRTRCDFCRRNRPIGTDEVSKDLKGMQGEWEMVNAGTRNVSFLKDSWPRVAIEGRRWVGTAGRQMPCAELDIQLHHKGPSTGTIIFTNGPNFGFGTYRIQDQFLEILLKKASTGSFPLFKGSYDESLVDPKPGVEAGVGWRLKRVASK